MCDFELYDGCSLFALVFDLASLFCFGFMQVQFINDWQYFRQLHSHLPTWITLDMIFVYLSLRPHLFHPIRLVHLRGPVLICMLCSGFFGVALVNSLTNRVKDHVHIHDRYFVAVLLLILLSVLLLVAFFIIFCVLLNLYKRGIELDDLHESAVPSSPAKSDSNRVHTLSFREVVEIGGAAAVFTPSSKRWDLESPKKL